MKIKGVEVRRSEMDGDEIRAAPPTARHGRLASVPISLGRVAGHSFYEEQEGSDWAPLLFWAIASPVLVLFWSGIAILAWEIW